MKYINRTILLAHIIIYFVNVQAQIDITLDTSHRGANMQALSERLDKADLVIEGKVLEKKGFTSHNNVFTSNVVLVYKLFKGNLTADTIEVVSRGGFLIDSNNEPSGAELVSNEYPLHINEEGIFFLRVNTWDRQLRPAPDSFVMWDRYRIEYLYPYERANPPAVFASTRFKSILNDVYPLVCGFLKKPYTIITINPHDKEFKK